MNFYKHFIGDYGRDTGHLTLVEHGAFRLMLDHFYATCRPLPQDPKSLYRLLRAESPAERKAIDSVSLQFWRPLPENVETLYECLGLNTEIERKPLGKVAAEWTEIGGLINIRALGEIVKSSVIAQKNRQTAISREQGRRFRVVGGANDAF